MSRPRRSILLLCAIGAIGLAPVWAGRQQSSAHGLSAPLRAHVREERFGIVTSIRGLPLGVRDGLQKLFDGALDIAEPGAGFQAAGVATDPSLPLRRLIAAGCARDHCLVHYERGGAARGWYVVLFHWTPAETRFEWGGTVTGPLKTTEEIVTAVVSDKVGRPPKDW